MSLVLGPAVPTDDLPEAGFRTKNRATSSGENGARSLQNPGPRGAGMFDGFWFWSRAPKKEVPVAQVWKVQARHSTARMCTSYPGAQDPDPEFEGLKERPLKGPLGLSSGFRGPSYFPLTNPFLGLRVPPVITRCPNSARSRSTSKARCHSRFSCFGRRLQDFTGAFGSRNWSHPFKHQAYKFRSLTLITLSPKPKDPWRGGLSWGSAFGSFRRPNRIDPQCVREA